MTQTAQTQWWLDESALPDYYWARLSLYQDGWGVLTLEGHLALFDDRDEAVSWLREDEYEALEDLKADGRVPGSLIPPSADTIEALVPLMRSRQNGETRG